MSDRQPWVSLLTLTLDRDASDWLVERRDTYRRTLRELADEVTELIGHSVSHETIRREYARIDSARAQASS